MLDPFIALSLAGNVVQFIDFSTKLVAKGNELYKAADGASVGNTELELIVKDLQGLNGRLQSRPSPEQTGTTHLVELDVALRKLSKQCSTVAGEMLDALEKRKVQGISNRRWKSFRQALRELMKKGDMDAITKRLQQVRDALNLHTLVSMRDTLDIQAIKQTEGFRDLDQITQDLLQRLEQDQDLLRQALTNHADQINHGQDQTNGIIISEHERTRRTILASLRSSQANQSSQTPQRLSEGSEDLGQKKKDALISSFLLASLRFPTMESRFEEIELAHEKTFE